MFVLLEDQGLPEEDFGEKKTLSKMLHKLDWFLSRL